MGLTILPNPGQSLLTTRNAIRNNFSVISTAFEVDHVAYNISGQGWHNKVTLPPQSSVPDTTGTDNIALYSKAVTVTAGTFTQLFYRKQNGGAEVDLTSAALTSPGWSRLPSGLLFKWGQTSGDPFGANPYTTITFPTTFSGDSIPEFTTILGVMPSFLNLTVSPPDTYESRALNITAYGNTSFTVALSGVANARTNTNIIWVAWGIG